MGTLGWILLGVGILLVNGSFWVVFYRRHVGVLLGRIARLEHRLVNADGRGQGGLMAGRPAGADRRRARDD